jgi:putative component of membrane protein insertase Oxa1/YidC/SpoIIIJ protein YidD
MIIVLLRLFYEIFLKHLIFSNINLPNDVEIKFQDNLVEFATCQMLCVLRKLKYVLNIYYLARIYSIFISPMSEYACTLWDGCSQQDSDYIEKLQLETERIVTGLSLIASREPIYSGTGCKLLSNGRRIRRLNLVYSIHIKCAPIHLYDLMPIPVGTVSQYDIQNSSKFVLPNCRLEITKKFFSISTTRD